jgi:glucose uptake protein
VPDLAAAGTEARRMSALIVLALAVPCFLAGASLSRLYVADGRVIILILGLSFYTVGNILMVRLIRETGLGAAISVSTILQLLLVNLVAFAVFGERPAPPQVLGIALGIVAVALILLPLGK